MTDHDYKNIQNDDHDVSDDFLALEQRLGKDLMSLPICNPVTHVYNPLDYAQDPHSQFVKKFVKNKQIKILLLGMNPGPWGMAQTGVPFGEITVTKEWLGISGVVRQPENIHPKKPVLGFDCKRKEVSGDRFWNFFKEIFNGDREEFSKHFVVYNHCPLVYMSETGKNVTPPEIKDKKIRDLIYNLCDATLVEIIQLLKVETVIGIGKFAENQARKAIKNFGNEELNHVKIGMIHHPSPASPSANKDWKGIVYKQLENLDILPIGS